MKSIYTFVAEHPLTAAAVAILTATVFTLGLIAVWPESSTAPTCPPDQSCPASTLPPPPAACSAELAHNDLPLNDLPLNDLPLNDLPLNDLPLNGLSAASLTANHDLLMALRQVGLTRDVFTTSITSPTVHPLLQPYAASLLKYITSCALDPCDVVDLPAGDQFQHLREDFPDGFQGQLGLCGKRYADLSGTTEPMWRAGVPTDACLERVSSCVLARVNAIGASVVFSMRGDGTALHDRVGVQTKYRENHGTPIRSFESCAVACQRGNDLRRNCDWEPRFVGQCVRGTLADDHATTRSAPVARVHLELNDPAQPSRKVQGRIRVCDGIYGCDDIDPQPGAGPSTAPVSYGGRIVTFPPYYGGAMIAQGRDSVDFDCPDNGPPIGDLRTGYYSVMLGATTSSPLTAATDVIATYPVTAPQAPPANQVYPAPETQVFTYREGAFYGMIFPPVGSTRLSPPPPGGDRTLAGSEYACQSAVWQAAQAAFAQRLCAGVSGCFANVPGQCDATPGACHVAAGSVAGRETYDTCTGNQDTWTHPYATYLNHPCDLFTSDDGCTPKLSSAIAATAAHRKHRGRTP